MWKWVAALSLACPLLARADGPPPPLRVLFLGDRGHHRPLDRCRQAQATLTPRNITIDYTERLEDLDPTNLARYQALLIYANHTAIRPQQERALIDYVEGGGGLVALHCASACFGESPAYLDLIGARFSRHGTGVFRTEAVAPDHPLLKAYAPFESWDETYVHDRHRPEGRTVLEVRASDNGREPWTWIRQQGKGRVFYTAWGHDQRTWSHPGFHSLLERGLRWAGGGDPAVAPAYTDRPTLAAIRADVAPFSYVPAKVPFYPAGEKWGTTGEPIARMQTPLSPEESIKHYAHPAGLEIRPFVAEDQLGGKPLAMTWDERGRLFVAVTSDYPNDLKRPEAGNDRIVVCTDENGDGSCDKVATYADRLSIPTSLLAWDGGLIVHQVPRTIFLRDDDGDGQAETRTTLLTGWGTDDTHAGPSSLRYGHDGWIYGINGYSGFDGNVAGEELSFRAGFHRFRVESGADGKPSIITLEFLRSTPGNAWGLGFNEEGVLFGSAANGHPSLCVPVPNRYGEKVRGLAAPGASSIALDNHFEPITENVRQVDWHGGFTAAAAHSIYTARAFPSEYWNRAAFVCEPTGHLTASLMLQPAGAGYVARYGGNLIASDDEWAAPIDAQVGPDGAVWVIDWYNFIVQHNPTPSGYETGRGAAYVTDLRDKTRGRIYRVVASQAGGTSAPEGPPTGWLGHSNMFWRSHGQRLLQHKPDPAATMALMKMIEDRRVDELGLNPGAIHAVWVLANWGERVGREAGRAAFASALAHPSAAVRRNAILAATTWRDGAEVAFDPAWLQDKDPQVRLAAWLSLADRPDAKPGAILAEAALRPETFGDPAIREAVTAAAAVHAPTFLTSALQAKSAWPAEALPLLQSVARHQAMSRDGDGPGALIVQLAQADPANRAAVVAGWASGWPRDKGIAWDEGGWKAIEATLAESDDATRANLLKLAILWGVPEANRYAAEVATSTLKIVVDPKENARARVAAAREAVLLRPEDDQVVSALADAITPQAPPALATGLLEALAGSRAAGLGTILTAKLATLTPSARTGALRLILARPASARALLDAVGRGEARFDWLALDQRSALANHPDAEIAQLAKALLAKGGGLPDANRQKVIDRLEHVIRTAGDVSRGSTLFANHCAKCHRHGEQGQTVGPDLTGMAVHPKEELLIHILDPSRSVEGNYRAYIAELSDGSVISGLLASESRTAIEMVDAEGKRHTLDRTQLDTLTETAKSLMPEGFEEQMKPAELADLLGFLTNKGRFVPLSLAKAATVASDRGMFYSTEAEAERIIFPDWLPKKVGEIPFHLVDPRDGSTPNVVLLHGPQGETPPRMPRTVSLPCGTNAKAIHLLGGVSGWGFPLGERGSVSMTVRLHYADGKSEDHPLRNGEHLADYIRRVDVPGSTFALSARGRQLRLVSLTPGRPDAIDRIELIKGDDATAPLVVAVTVERPEDKP